MKFSWRKEGQTEGLIQAPTMSGDDGKKSGGLMIGVEKGLSEALLFTISVVLHLSNSLEGEHGARS